VIRKRCAKRGHKWQGTLGGFMSPIEFCSRLFCSGERPAGWVAEPLAGALDTAINKNSRKHP
jgi:hypothetical protein